MTERMKHSYIYLLAPCPRLSYKYNANERDRSFHTLPRHYFAECSASLTAVTAVTACFLLSSANPERRGSQCKRKRSERCQDHQEIRKRRIAMHQRTKGPVLQKGKRRYMLQANIIQRDRAGRMAHHRSQGRHHEWYAVCLPGFFARVVPLF